MIAALQLDNFFTESFFLGTNTFFDPNIKEGRVPGKIECSLEIAFPEEEGKFPYRVALTVSLDPALKTPARDPYSIKTHIVGFFTISGNPSQEEKERMLSLNGGTILYGMIRGMVAQVTGSGQFGKYIMPAINLVEMYKKRDKLKQTKKMSGSKEKPSSTRRKKQVKAKVKS